MPLESGRSLGGFRLIEKLGEGGMGVVWRARDDRLGRDVALKCLADRYANDTERLERLEREARAVAALSHPNILTIFALEEAEGVHFLATELVEGEPLSRLVPSEGLPIDRLLAIAIPLADAIASAHERGILHRDLKPGNILVGKNGAPKVLDFGLATMRAPGRPPAEAGGSEAATKTGPATVTGTVGYMSPEQVRGEPLDHRTDLFSLGVLLFEMATGRTPFLGATAADTIASLLKDDPPSLESLRPGLPRPFVVLVGHCLEKDRRRRIQSAGELRHGLERVRDGLSVESVAASRPGPSVAVLPFADLSPERDQEYFCDGMAEEIIDVLNGIEGLRVASRTSSFCCRGSDLGTREIGRRLGVATLLEGSVRKAGRRLRVTAQLVDVVAGFPLWSGRFDREIDDVFAVQEEIARAIADALEVTLDPGERRGRRKAQTRDVQAYDYYLRGRKFFFQYGRREVEFALQLFSRAVELDSGYALAHAGLAECWAFLYMYAERNETFRERALAESGRAVALDPGCAQSHASRGLALSLERKDDEADAAFETAIRIDPDHFEAHYFRARHAFVCGRLEEAARQYEQAARVRPEDYQALLLVAQIYEDLGRPEAAEAARRRGIRAAETHLDLNPDDARAVYMAANGMAGLGELERGVEWAERARAMAPKEPMVLYNVGCIYSLAGRADEAIDILERAVALGLAQKGWFDHDSNLDAVREHPRFLSLMKKMEEAPGSAILPA